MQQPPPETTQLTCHRQLSCFHHRGMITLSRPDIEASPESEITVDNAHPAAFETQRKATLGLSPPTSTCGMNFMCSVMDVRRVALKIPYRPDTSWNR